MAEKIIIKIIMEILGAPKEHVEDTMKLVGDKMKKREDTKLIEYKEFPAEPVKDQPFFSSFSEAELEFKTIEDVIGFCFDFMPSSIEFVQPSDLKLNANELNSLLNDLLARLHQYDMVLKNVHAQNTLMKRELDKLKDGKKD
ncbi:MAG: hypothetical protein Q8R00_04265 [Candidatus Nanoarchaeia archaeon]|nr:hypothetical protein [Candidatus Nanoarchaeia archaeon]